METFAEYKQKHRVSPLKIEQLVRESSSQDHLQSKLNNMRDSNSFLKGVMIRKLAVYFWRENGPKYAI